MIWYVRSTSARNVYHLVRASGPHAILKCQCRAAQFRPRVPCAHVKAVVAGEARLARLKAA